MRVRSGIGIVVAFTAAIVGCQRLSPADFWNSFRSQLIVARQSDQGPWGGYRWIQWTSRPGAFVEADVISFAEKNGWRCVARSSYSADKLSDWVGLSRQPIFPLFYPEHSPSHKFFAGDAEHFPRHITSDLIVLEFASGWVRVRPGSGHDETAYGYAVLSTDGAKLAVYHLWGEM